MVKVSRGISQKGYIQLEDLLWAPAWWDKVLCRTLQNTSMVSLWHLYGTIIYRGVSTMTHWTLQLSKTAPPVWSCWGGDGGQLVMLVNTTLPVRSFLLSSFVLYISAYCPAVLNVLLGADPPIRDSQIWSVKTVSNTKSVPQNSSLLGIIVSLWC